MEAYHNIWIVADTFLKDCAGSLKILNSSAIASSDFKLLNNKAVATKQVKNKLFIHQNFNISIQYAGLVVRGVNRLLYPFTELLNIRHKLPKYILVILDKDMITAFKNQSFNKGIVMGSTIHYLICQFDLVER